MLTDDSPSRAVDVAAMRVDCGSVKSSVAATHRPRQRERAALAASQQSISVPGSFQSLPWASVFLRV